MVYVPRYVYGTGPVTLDLSISQQPWVVSVPTIGGGEFSAAGVPASFQIRRDHFLEQRIRFYEWEWPDVAAMLAYAQRWPNEVTAWLDRDDAGSAHDCYLIAPQLGDEITPARESGTDYVYALSLIWRKLDNSPWTDFYFPEVS